MSRDLGGEVEKLMKSANPYIKKKVNQFNGKNFMENKISSRLFFVLFVLYEKFLNNLMYFKIQFEVYSVKKIMV